MSDACSRRRLLHLAIVTGATGNGSLRGFLDDGVAKTRADQPLSDAFIKSANEASFLQEKFRPSPSGLEDGREATLAGGSFEVGDPSSLSPRPSDDAALAPPPEVSPAAPPAAAPPVPVGDKGEDPSQVAEVPPPQEVEVPVEDPEDPPSEVLEDGAANPPNPPAKGIKTLSDGEVGVEQQDTNISKDAVSKRALQGILSEEGIPVVTLRVQGTDEDLYIPLTLNVGDTKESITVAAEGSDGAANEMCRKVQETVRLQSLAVALKLSGALERFEEEVGVPISVPDDGLDFSLGPKASIDTERMFTQAELDKVHETEAAPLLQVVYPVKEKKGETIITQIVSDDPDVGNISRVGISAAMVKSLTGLTALVDVRADAMNIDIPGVDTADGQVFVKKEVQMGPTLAFAKKLASQDGTLNVKMADDWNLSLFPAKAYVDYGLLQTNVASATGVARDLLGQADRVEFQLSKKEADAIRALSTVRKWDDIVNVQPGDGGPEQETLRKIKTAHDNLHSFQPAQEALKNAIIAISGGKINDEPAALE